VVEKVSANPIFIDGPSTRDYRSQVLTQRRELAKDGVVVVVLSTDSKTGLLAAPPKVISRGFMEEGETGELYEDIIEEVHKALNLDSDLLDQSESANSKVRKIARSLIAKSTRRRPMIVPVVLEV
jgi:ribonuclease J